MSPNDRVIAEYLKTVTAMTGDRSLVGFVQKQGRFFTAQPLPAQFKKQPNNQCFMNAFKLALANKDLIYVEGYAHRVISMLHAWCVTPNGVVVDNTWERPEEGAYFGIPMNLQFVSRTLVRQKVYGLLGTPQTVREMFDMNPEAFKQEMV